MDFNLSDEQKMIRDAVEKFVRNDYAFDARRKIVDSKDGFSRDIWQQFAEFGWLGVALPEEYGGFDGSMIETMQVMEPFGSAMVVEPYLSTAVLGGNAINLAGTAEQKQALLPQLIAGELILALAYHEEGSRYNLADVNTKAEKTGNGYTITGGKSVVLAAPWADKFIVSARTSGSPLSEDGISLFLIDAKATGVSVTPYKTMDGSCGGNVRLEGVQVDSGALLGTEGQGLSVLEAVVDMGTAAACAEALGAMQSAYQKTLEYVKTRKQFGVPIGSFQVLQHRLVDMFSAVEMSRSISYMVAMRAASNDPVERKKAVSAAKAYMGDKARFVAQQSVQIHGGVGMTEELDIGHYFRRLTMFGQLFGSTDHHLQRFADLSE